MKKAFDQTVRDLKREVNKKVLKVPGIEQKILDATSNESWGPHGSHLADLAQATRNHHEYLMIMTVIWKRINDTGKNWRHVYKALIVLEYLVAHGSERVIDEVKEHAYQISTLADFQYIDSSGRDQGSNVRRKSQSLVALVNNRERIQEVREKALANKERYHSSAGGAYRPGSYSGSGDYGDRYDDDRFGGHYESRDADRNGYGRERDRGYRDDDRYSKGVDPYNQDGDHYRRDSDERYGRDSYRDDEYRGSHGTDDYQFGSGNRRSTDRYTERSFDDDDRRTSRNGVRRADDLSEDERQLEHRLSRQNVGAPPSYEEATQESHNHIHHDRNEGNVDALLEKESSSSPPKPALPTDDRSQSLDQASIGVPAASLNQVNGFDEFDPRGSISGALPSAGSPEMDFLGSLSASDPVNSLTMTPVSSSTTPEVDPMNLGSEMIYEAPSMASPVSGKPYENPFGDVPFKATPQDNSMAQSQNLAPVSSFLPSSTVTYGAQTLQSEVPKHFEDPFGDTPFKAMQQDSFTAQPQNVASDSSFQLPSGTSGGAQPLQSEVPKAEAAPSFDFGDTLGGLTYTPTITNGQQTPANQGFLHAELPGAQASRNPLGAFMQHTGPSALVSSHGTQPVAPMYVQTAESNLLPQSGILTHAPPAAPTSLQLTQPAPSTNIQTDQLNLLPQSGLSATQNPAVSTTSSAGQLASNQPSKAKFEPKSAVWADTLSRGLVDLNISGPKTNPLADIGVDFDSINRMDKRKEKKSSTAPVTSTITMGKAMGAGSGMGRAGASGLAPPPNTMMGSGMSMGIGGSIGMGMGGSMGTGMAVYGGNMSQPMGMGMGMGMNMNMNMGMGMGRGMNMGMGQGAPMQPPIGMPPPSPGMPGVGYNPMMGTGGYGPQHPYGGGGYR